MSQPSFASRALLLTTAFAILYQVAYPPRREDEPAAEVPARGRSRSRRRQSDPAVHPFARVPKTDNESLLAAVVEPGDRGRAADTPSELTAPGWKDILVRTYQSISSDRVFALSAGVTYYILLSLFPALTALVSIFGLFGDTAAIGSQIDSLAWVIPGGGLDIIHEQLDRLASQKDAALGFAFLLGLGTSLWSANASVKALFDALNVVYGERERRGFFKLNLLSLLFTIGLLIFTVIAIGAIVILPTVLNLVFLGHDTEWLIALLRWPALLVVVVLGLSVIYRFGPSRADPKWRWVTWGSLVATILWLIVSMGFSWYVANFGSYNETYGSLGAVIGFMIWAWLSVSVILLGGELNAEMEHQTARDTTTGAPQPMGLRGAEMADTLGAAQR
jgi:membrane protein